MKTTETIVNVYDGHVKPVKKMKSEPIQLDYAYSNSAAEIDTGIRETIKGIRLSVMAMSIGLAKIKEKGLYVDLNFRSMNKYIEQLCIDTKMDRSSLFNWIRIGESYLKYRNDLEKIGFSDGDGPTKLAYIDRALESNPKQIVFKRIKDMSVREFKTFSKGEAEEKTPKEKRISIKENEVFIGGKKAVIISDHLDSKTRSYFKKIILTAGKAMQQGEVILPVRFYDQEEMRQMERSIDNLIKARRSGK